MVSSPCQCPGTAGKICNWFLPARDKDLQLLCDDCCSDCHHWDNNMWQKVSDYHAKLATQTERKKKRKIKAAFFFFLFLSVFSFCANSFM